MTAPLWRGARVYFSPSQPLHIHAFIILSSEPNGVKSPKNKAEETRSRSFHIGKDGAVFHEILGAGIKSCHENDYLAKGIQPGDVQRQHDAYADHG